MKIILLISAVFFSQISLARNLDSSPMNCKTRAGVASSESFPQDVNSNILSSALFESREQIDDCPELISIVKKDGAKIILPLTEVTEKSCQYNVKSSVEYSVICESNSAAFL